MQIDNRYWAGLFDGEGNIYFSKDLVHIQVGLAQKEVAVLYLLRNRFRGKINRCNNCHRWEGCSKKVNSAFLEAVKPYLIVKRIEAEIALEAMSGWRESRNYKSGLNHTLPKEEMDRRQVLKDKMDAERLLTKDHSPIT